MNKQLWNFFQKGRGVLQLKPLGCLSNHSPSFCSGCEPGQVYECQACGYLQPWCKGAADNYFELCDHCWGLAEQMHNVIKIPMESEK